jgi:Glycosyl hydrolase family 20, catalytic domain/Glycosyl hydrolase family 20, domain 2
MRKTIYLFMLLALTAFACHAADYTLFDASWPNAVKKWKRGSSAKKVEINKITDPTMGDVIKIRVKNIKSCYLTLENPTDKGRQGKLYNAIQVTYKYASKPKIRRAVLQFYMRDATLQKTFRYAVGVPASLTWDSKKMATFWRRSTSPVPVLSKLSNLLLEFHAGTEILIKDIKLIEGGRRQGIELKSINGKISDNITVKSQELQHNKKAGVFSLRLYIDSQKETKLNTEISAAPLGKKNKILAQQVSKLKKGKSSILLPFSLKDFKTGKYKLSLTMSSNKKQKQIRNLEFYVWKFEKPEYSKITLWPRPKKIELGTRSYLLPETLSANISGKGPIFPLQLLQEKLNEQYGVVVKQSTAQTANIKLIYEKLNLKPEGFKILVNSEGFVLRAADKRGMYYAVRTLLNIIRQSSMGDKAANCRFVSIIDWPQTPLRIFHHRIDTPYKTPITPDAYKRLIYDQIAAQRYNLITLICRGGIQYTSHPEISFGNAITKKGMKEIIDFARKHYVDIAPGGNSPGHCDWILNTHPEFKEDGSYWEMCMNNPEAYKFVTEVYTELLDLFKPAKYFMLGGDEISWSGTLKTPVDKRCKKCRGVTKRQQLLEHWTKLAKFCQKRGARPILFDDMLSETWSGGGIFKTAKILQKLPRNIIITTWGHGAAPVPPRKLIKMGFTPWHVNTLFGPNAYKDFLDDARFYPGKGIGEYIHWPWSGFNNGSGDRLPQYTAPGIHTCAGCSWDFATGAGSGWKKMVDSYGNDWMKTMNVPQWGTRKISFKEIPLDKNYKTAKAGAVPFAKSCIEVASETKSKVININQKIRGVYILQSMKTNESGMKKLRKMLSYQNTPLGIILGRYEVKYEDQEGTGQMLTFPAIMGWNVQQQACYSTIRIMQGAECFLVDGKNCSWSFSWKNPYPGIKVKSISLIGVDAPVKMLWEGLTLVK